MEVHNLDFARIVLLRDDIAEMIVNQNVEMDSAMIDAYHAFLVGHLRAPFSLLINKINTYSYTFEAQRKLVAIPEINAMAARKGLDPSAFEYQMLYGIQREEQIRLAREGYRVRVMINYGTYWFPWYMRRLAERPANLWFVARNLFAG
jgi:hypothetical protein